MNEKKPPTARRQARAFVPKLTLRRAVVAVAPFCAASVMVACSGDDDDTTGFTVAAIGFDAGTDASVDASGDARADADADATPVIVALAVIGFDAAMDSAATDAAGATDAADAADGAG